MVDCHGRFDVESAVVVAEELAELGVDWFEEPVRPNEEPADSARIAARVLDDGGRWRDGIWRGAFRGPD